MYNKINIKFTIFIVLAISVLVSVFAITVYANEQNKLEFSIEEKEDTILQASEGQQQVRLVQLKEMQEVRRIEEERLAEEKRIEDERLAKEAKEAEDKRIAEKAKAKKEELAKETKKQTVATSNTEEVEDNNATTSSSSTAANNQNGTNLGTFQATAYGPDCYGCSGITANGTDIRNGNIYSGGYRVIAADPRVIPMNSIVKITYSSGQTEMAIVADTGGAIKGNIIDIAFASEAETPAFGRQQVQLELIK